MRGTEAREGAHGEGFDASSPLANRRSRRSGAGGTATTRSGGPYRPSAWRGVGQSGPRADRAEEAERLYRERCQGFTVKPFHEHLVKDHGFGWGS